MMQTSYYTTEKRALSYTVKCPCCCAASSTLDCDALPTPSGKAACFATQTRTPTRRTNKQKVAKGSTLESERAMRASGYPSASERVRFVRGLEIGESQTGVVARAFNCNRDENAASAIINNLVRPGKAKRHLPVRSRQPSKRMLKLTEKNGAGHLE